MMFSITVSYIYAVLIGICSLLWYCSTYTFDYWKKEKIPFKKPLPIVGSIGLQFLKKSYPFLLHDLYTSFQDYSYVGYFEMLTPKLLIKDADLVHNILVRNFSNFYDRDFDFFLPHKKINPIQMNLFTARGDRWKALRKKMNTGFSLSKLRAVHEQILLCIVNLNKTIEKSMVNGSTDQNLNLLYGRLSLNVIGSCALGIECNSLQENEEFRMVRKAIDPTFLRVLTTMLNKHIRIALKIPDFPKDAVDFFSRMILDAVYYRREKSVSRNDFLQLLMELQNSNTDEERDNAAETKNKNLERFDENDLVANSLLFLVAGFETTSIGITHCLYEVALNQKIQDDLRTEVTEAYHKHNQTITANMLKDLQFLNAVISETLRKYPSLPFLNRVSAEDYQIPNSNHVIKKGTKITIPVWSIHHDEKYYKNPELFDPGRFIGQDKNVQKGTYIPFGDGPRNCIGAQFAKMEIRAAVADAVMKYRFTACSRTEIPLTYNRRSILVVAENGVWVTITKLNK